MDWEPMNHAPRDGTLIDLNFAGIRHIDCHFDSRHNCWAKDQGYPSTKRIFFQQPTGWMYRPAELVMPYHTNDAGDRYIP